MFWPFGVGIPAACSLDCWPSVGGMAWPGDVVAPVAPDVPPTVVELERVPALQTFAARAARSSSGVGAEPATTTSVTRRTSRPWAVRAEMRYVPGAIRRPCTLLAKRMRLMPGCPATVNRAKPRQRGATWFTVKTTRPLCGRTKLTVVVCRRLAPVVPIHGCDEWRCWTWGPLPAGVLAPPDAPAELEPELEEDEEDDA